MIASIGGGSGFDGAAGYCLGGGEEKEIAVGQEQEEELMPGLGGDGEEEKRERQATVWRSARERQQGQASPPGGWEAGRDRGEEEERKRRAREREREKKAAKAGVKRVLWTETRHLATNDVMRGSRMMEATARDAPVLKRLAGVKATGRKLKKPMVHYSLSWAPDERPVPWAMSQAVDGSLKALGLEHHQALVVAHGDTQHPHVHVIVNRVHPETGKAANMGRDRIKLSKWAEGYERKQGRIRCPQRPANNARRALGEWVRGQGQSQGQHHRGRVRMRRTMKAADPARISQVAWWRAEERTHWEKGLQKRAQAVGELETRQRQDWREVYQYHQEQRDQQAKACRRVLGRLKTWSAEGRRMSEAGAVLTGRPEVVEGWGRALEKRQRRDRTLIAKEHMRQFREIEQAIEKTYRERLQGADERAHLAARTGGFGHGYNHEVDELRGHEWVDREEVEQRRELYGGPTYEQVLKDRAERSARFEQSIRERARERPRERERSRDRDEGPSR